MASEITPKELPEPRYEYGADDHVFVELAEEMSFTANFKAMAITQQVAERAIDGIIENCPANASYMLRIDPGVIHPDEVIAELKEIEAATDIENYEWETRVIDVPVLFEDPWTHETLMEFRDRHQDPDGTDLEYSAQLNGFDDVESFLDAFVSAPHMVTMVGFVPGLPWCFQMVPRDQQQRCPNTSSHGPTRPVARSDSAARSRLFTRSKALAATNCTVGRPSKCSTSTSSCPTSATRWCSRTPEISSTTDGSIARSTTRSVRRSRPERTSTPPNR